MPLPLEQIGACIIMVDRITNVKGLDFNGIEREERREDMDWLKNELGLEFRSFLDDLKGRLDRNYSRLAKKLFVYFQETIEDPGATLEMKADALLGLQKIAKRFPEIDA